MADIIGDKNEQLFLNEVSVEYLWRKIKEKFLMLYSTYQDESIFIELIADEMPEVDVDLRVQNTEGKMSGIDINSERGVEIFNLGENITLSPDAKAALLLDEDDPEENFYEAIKSLIKKWSSGGGFDDSQFVKFNDDEVYVDTEKMLMISLQNTLSQCYSQFYQEDSGISFTVERDGENGAMENARIILAPDSMSLRVDHDYESGDNMFSSIGLNQWGVIINNLDVFTTITQEFADQLGVSSTKLLEALNELKGGGMTLTEGDARYLKLSGGTLTGDITLSNKNINQIKQMYFTNGISYQRWWCSTNEPMFRIFKLSSSDTYVYFAAQPQSFLNSSTGEKLENLPVRFNGIADPTEDYDAVNKRYAHNNFIKRHFRIWMNMSSSGDTSLYCGYGMFDIVEKGIPCNVVGLERGTSDDGKDVINFGPMNDETISDANSMILRGIATPTKTNDAANKAYVDTKTQKPTITIGNFETSEGSPLSLSATLTWPFVLSVRRKMGNVDHTYAQTLITGAGNYHLYDNVVGYWEVNVTVSGIDKTTGALILTFTFYDWPYSISSDDGYRFDATRL